MSEEKAIVPIERDEIIAKVVMFGDLSKLKPLEKAEYYSRLCMAVGLNPVTKPFEYVTMNGREVLYANRMAAEQLRKSNGVSITNIEKENIDGLYIVTVVGKDATGRTDVATGIVEIIGLKGQVLANAMMKAETKAKRRLTLSICGLGMMDETEISDVKVSAVVEENTPEALMDARVKIEKVIERYEPFLAVQFIEAKRMDADNAETLGDLREIYAEIKSEGKKAETKDSKAAAPERFAEDAKRYAEKVADPTDEELAAEIAAHDEQKELY